MHPLHKRANCLGKSYSKALQAVSRVVHFFGESRLGSTTARAVYLSQSQISQGLLRYSREGHAFFTHERCRNFHSQLLAFQTHIIPRPGSHLQLLRAMVATLEVVPWAWVHMHTLQCAFLGHWSPCSQGYNGLPNSLLQDASLELPDWLVVTIDASLKDWGAHCLGWTALREALWPINRLGDGSQAGVVGLDSATFQPGSEGIVSHCHNGDFPQPSRGGTKCSRVAQEMSFCFCGPSDICRLSLHIAGRRMCRWISSVTTLDPSKLKLAPWAFRHTVHCWGSLSLDLMATFASVKVLDFFSHRREQGSKDMDALVQPWSLAVLYVFPPWVIIQVLRRSVSHLGMVIFVAPDWPWSPWYADLVWLLVAASLDLGSRRGLLRQGPVMMDKRLPSCLWLGP